MQRFRLHVWGPPRRRALKAENFWNPGASCTYYVYERLLFVFLTTYLHYELYDFVVYITRSYR